MAEKSKDFDFTNQLGVVSETGIDDSQSDPGSRDSSSYSEKKNVSITVDGAYTHEPDAIIARIQTSGDMDDILTEDADFIVGKLNTLDVTESLRVVTHAFDYFKDDINYPEKSLHKIQLLIQGEEAYGQGPALYDLDLRLEAALIKFHSPYPEVRSVCSPTDDPTIPVETLRAYLIGFFWVAVGSFVNQILLFRQPSFSLSSQVIQILSVPCGQLAARILPDVKIFGMRLNPGPWTFKEQMFVTIITNVGAHGAVFLDYAPVMRLKLFYGQTWMSYGFTVVMGLTSELFGLGFGGILRRWAVYPVKAVWPTILPTIQLNKTLLNVEKKQVINGWSLSKYKFFNIFFAISFIYFFVPDYLFTALATFNWMTWIAPKNKNLAFITGSRIGLGYNPITSFDWSVINYSTPLILPFYTTLNRYLGTLLGGIIIIIMYYTNYQYTAYIPPNTADVYDRYGNVYNVSKVLRHGKLDVDLYKQYSPPYISAGNLMTQAVTYVIYTFGFMYIILTEWHVFKEAIQGFFQGLRKRKMSTFEQFDDPVSVLMRKYPEVPDWWFLVVLAISFVIGCVAMAAFPTTTPVWVIIVVLVASVALLIPFIVLYASTGYFLSMNMLSTIIGGYLVPGNGLASLFTRTFGFALDDQSETFMGDQKLAHYSKLPPRAVFRAQLLATLIQIFASAGAFEVLVGFPNFCSYTQVSRFTCTFVHTLYSQSILLGVIGPHRTFDELYPILKYCFLIGALIALPVFYAKKLFPTQLRLFHPVLFLGGITRFSWTYNLSYYTPGMYAAIAFMYYIRKRYLAWWAKYNYILSSALTAGVAFSGILIFLALQYRPKTLVWWGNKVSSAGVDGKEVATLRSVAEGGYFGVADGTWS
ncbi:OPT oligopeptide transporter protein-domain-containing protein [Lipomyces japonicus]|uniref:OPT oligopeptide transporter protein-domain-containing protein n=1 Tax=Lipomyces japonicus TaxID=56871 RepID=UPI0034CDF254